MEITSRLPLLFELLEYLPLLTNFSSVHDMVRKYFDLILLFKQIITRRLIELLERVQDETRNVEIHLKTLFFGHKMFIFSFAARYRTKSWPNNFFILWYKHNGSTTFDNLVRCHTPLQLRGILVQKLSKRSYLLFDSLIASLIILIL